MTTQEILDRVNSLKPNTIDDNLKIEWLIGLDTKIKQEIIDTHEGIDKEVGDYNANRDIPLIVVSPYDELYIAYIMAKIDFYMADISRYNNEMAMYNTQLSQYYDYINRTYKPVYRNNLKV